MDLKTPILIESLVGLLIGVCIIAARTRIAQIFSNFASRHSMDYSVSQERILITIVWVIGLVFIFGGILQIIRMLAR